MTSPARRAVVVGGGLGGLAAAARLAAGGWRVLVLERQSEVGGKCGRRTVAGCAFDTGPSVLTVPHLLDAHFAACGRRREDYLAIEPVEPGCRYFFADGTRWDAPGTLPGFREAVARDFPSELAGFDRFSRYIARLWSVSERFFLTRPLDAGALAAIRWRDVAPAMALMRPGSLRAAVEAHFKDPRLVQVFSRFATYNGSDPWRTPAAFAVIAHAELAFGSWRCRGGMVVLARALERLARDLGVEVRTGTEVEAVLWEGTGRRARAAGVRLAGGGEERADAVVVNADAVGALTGPLLAGHPEAEALARRWGLAEPSTSGLVLLAVVRAGHPAAAVHNVVFPRDYRAEFRALFAERELPADPTVYVSVPARAEPSLAAEGREGWFVLVNAPSVPERSAWPEATGEWLLERLASGPLAPPGGTVEAWETISPADFAERLGAWRGSLYGPSSNRLLAAFARVPNGGVAGGLYLAGGSAHPGGGIPLVVTGGRLAAEAAIRDAGGGRR